MLDVVTLMFFFFFSSRRRHTRFDCDWSSDVCSSDLDRQRLECRDHRREEGTELAVERRAEGDRKSTRLNSSHSQISYAVFCLKKKLLQPQRPVRHRQARDGSPRQEAYIIRAHD